MLNPLPLVFALLTLPTLPTCPQERVGSRRSPSSEQETVTLAAVGDILLDRGVGRQIERHGADYPFRHAAPILREADIAFGNLECPISESGRLVVKPFRFRAHPRVLDGLVNAGFDVLSLANNHTLDCGRDGLIETMEHLKRKGILGVGAGGTRAQAEEPVVLQAKGVRVAFVGFCDFIPEGVFLRDDRASIAMASAEGVRRSVKRARAQADIVIVSFHWGIEYRARPSPRQIELARAAAESGADLVLGHHPHVLQGLEAMRVKTDYGERNVLIAYSLGNFVFDPRGEEPSRTMILRVTLRKAGLVGAQILPFRLQDGSPRPALPAESAAIIQRVTALSAEKNTILTDGRIVLNRTRLEP
jgi:poly-gamma-glutamate capsule biosynthesis protein CapA/YwtB (metallophosphatase superfamily)